jgi:glycosyltransferase involved in cell wall biosynthesis
MNKVFEYMALGIPFVGFDLIEGRKVAGNAALYAKDNCPVSLAGEISRLVDDEALRAELAAEGQKRAKTQLNWDVERAELLAAYDLALGEAVRPAAAPQPTG